MTNLYNKEDLNDIVNRLKKLKTDAKREWGSMSVSQMLVHLNVSLEPAMGLKFPKRKLLSIFFKPNLEDGIFK